jgi:hypothetical protein
MLRHLAEDARWNTARRPLPRLDVFRQLDIALRGRHLTLPGRRIVSCADLTWLPDDPLTIEARARRIHGRWPTSTTSLPEMWIIAPLDGFTSEGAGSRLRLTWHDLAGRTWSATVPKARVAVRSPSSPHLMHGVARIDRNGAWTLELAVLEAIVAARAPVIVDSAQERVLVQAIQETALRFEKPMFVDNVGQMLDVVFPDHAAYLECLGMSLPTYGTAAEARLDRLRRVYPHLKQLVWRPYQGETEQHLRHLLQELEVGRDPTPAQVVAGAGR